MSVPSPSQEFQEAIHAALLFDAALDDLVEGRIYDGKPPADAAFPRITYGPSDYVPQQLQGIDARLEAVQVDVWSRVNGELYEAKAIVDAVERVLNGADLTTPIHAISSCEVTLVRVFRDPDQITAHGVVQFEAMVERK